MNKNICFVILAASLFACSGNGNVSIPPDMNTQSKDKGLLFDGGPLYDASTDACSPGVFSCQCGHGLGYWKNHTDQMWISIFNFGNSDYSKDQVVGFLQSPVMGDASLLLVRQMVVFLLDDGSVVDPLFLASQKWLSDNGTTLPYDISPSSDPGKSAMDLVVKYNCGQ